MTQSSPAAAPHANPPSRDEISARRGRGGWSLPLTGHLFSLLLHAGLLFLAATSFESFATTDQVGEGGDVRTVGIYVKTEADAADPAENPPVENADAATFAQSATALAQPSETPSMAEQLLDLPQVEPLEAIGPGGAPSPMASADVGNLIKSTGTAPSRPTAALGHQETSFFNVRDKGTRFIYLLDSSGSMLSHNAIGVAKAELMASLQNLDSTQQFQIIFYNNLAIPMSQRGSDDKLYWATDINRTIARQFIATVQPEGGTLHLPALVYALKYGPEVVFLLTDSDTQLSPGELDELRRLNGGRTRIHCIEFGKGPALPGAAPNFLQKLAAQNGGVYRYRDVTKFGRK